MSYNPARDVTPAFLDRAAGWIERTGEVLVVLRYLGAGGNDYAFCRTRSEFEGLVDAVPMGTDVMVFRDRLLPIRGFVDDAFLRAALDSFSEGEEFLLMTDETEPGGTISRRAAPGDSLSDLLESLSELRGVEVALGPCPDLGVADHEGLVSAAKGGVDGPR